MYYADRTLKDQWYSVLIIQFYHARYHSVPIDFNDVQSWIYRDRSEQCSDIIGTETLSRKENNLPNPVYKVPSTLSVVH